MRLDLYQEETERIASGHAAVLQEARIILDSGRKLSALEANGLLHALQVLIENAIGKAKQLLKANEKVVPVSAYHAFAALASAGLIREDELKAWNAMIGIRNRIVHDYMNIDLLRLCDLVVEERYQFVVDFLVRRA